MYVYIKEKILFLQKHMYNKTSTIEQENFFGVYLMLSRTILTFNVNDMLMTFLQMYVY